MENKFVSAARADSFGFVVLVRHQTLDINSQVAILIERREQANLIVRVWASVKNISFQECSYDVVPLVAASMA